jgi:hypothetical protein
MIQIRFIRLGCKGLSGTNALAYLSIVSLVKEKSFVKFSIKRCFHCGENRSKLMRFKKSNIYFLIFKMHLLRATFAIVLTSLKCVGYKTFFSGIINNQIS